MNISNPVSSEVRGVHFSFYGSDDIRRLSVKRITNPLIFDGLEHPAVNGLYDPALGPYDKSETCTTCFLGHSLCPGHFGHIDLTVPVYNPITFRILLKLFSSLCYYCHHLRSSRLIVAHFFGKLRLIHAGLIVEASELDQVVALRSAGQTNSGGKGRGKAGSAAQKKQTQRSSRASTNLIDDSAMEVIDDENAMRDAIYDYNHAAEYAAAEAAAEVDVEIAPATQEEMIVRIEAFVNDALAAKSSNSAAAARVSKTTLLTESLRRVERQFLAIIPKHACQNCGGQSPKIRNDGDIKIFERPLNSKQIAISNARGLKLQDIFANTTAELTDKDAAQGQRNNGHFSAGAAAIATIHADDDYQFLAPTSGADTIATRDKYLTPIQVRAHIELLWKNEKTILDLLYGSPVPGKRGVRESSPTIFFIDAVAVPPTRFRPVSKLMDMQYEHPQNTHLTEVIKSNIGIQDLERSEREALRNAANDPKLQQIRRAEFLKRTVDAWIRLQQSVNFLIDSSKAPLAQGKTAPPGVRQLLEKKEGLFRKHMMGKRVNYAARSVISPDPYIETNEIGIPPVFATKLTYPEPVGHHNFKEMRRCVINGPDKWPGAAYVQNEDGSLVNLGVFDEAGRTAIANQLLTPSMHHGETNPSHHFNHVNKKVYRHLRNGDFLLLNRQPTLHKPSIMAHTARVLPGEKTIRMHYANCNTYNADFDGDEMNAHLPQNELARAEAMLIARTDQQYLVPTDGGVLRGLIQDHVDAGVDMCSRDSFYTRDVYMQLVYAGLSPEGSNSLLVGNGNIEPPVTIGRGGRIMTLPPAIMKPVQRWTGKQILSTVIQNMIPENRKQLNLQSKSRIPAKRWGPSAPEEQQVLIMDGELLTGILDKSQFGASAGGLVHAVYEVYGPSYAGKLLSILGRLFTTYLQFTGFTCRIDDLLLTEEGDAIRRDLIDGSRDIGLDAVAEVTGVKVSHATTEEIAAEASGAPPPQRKNPTVVRERAALSIALENVLRDSEKMAALDSATKSRTNKTTSSIISSCIPDHLLKSFPANNMQVMTVAGAKGSGVNVSQISCLLGQQELEGKRVPTMISGKTLPSFLPFDTAARAGGYITGRFLTGIRPQEFYFHCMAGREGLIDTAVKTSRSGYLQRCLIKHLEGLRVHYDHTVRELDGSVVQFHYGEDALDVVKQTTLTKFDFCALNYHALVERYDPSRLAGRVDEDSVPQYIKRMQKLDRKSLAAAAAASSSGKASTSSAEILPKRDPILSMFSPSKCIGAISDKFSEALTAYMNKNKLQLVAAPSSSKKGDNSAPKAEIRSPWSFPRISSRNFKLLMELKYMHSLVEPGEAVGLLAAQSIGEPSTQMTLNTFHFAGFGAKNVTLGIPRLREIIMTASASIKTPLMRLPMRPGITPTQSEVIAERISRLVLSQIMQGLTVREQLTRSTGPLEQRHKLVTIRLEFWDALSYRSQYGLSPDDIGRVIETKFVPLLERAIVRDLKARVRKGGVSDDVVNDGGAASGAGGAGDDNDEIGVSLGRFDDVGGAGRARSGANDGDGDQGDSEDPARDDGGDGERAAGSRRTGNKGRRDTGAGANEISAAIVDDDDDDDDNDDADSDGGNGAGGADGDATAARSSSKRKQHASYDAPDEDDEEVIDALNRIDRDDDDEDDDGDDEDNAGGIHARAAKVAARSLMETSFEQRELQDEVNAEAEEVGMEVDSDEDADGIDHSGMSREKRILQRSKFVSAYKFDRRGRWCELVLQFPSDTKKILMAAIAEDICSNVVIREVKGISRCYSLPAETETDMSVNIGTDGVNIRGLWNYDDVVDVNHMYTNDIAAVLATYGVEAARAAIMQEIASVFGVYGINVDPRHLSLIADYMTFEGGYKPFNRIGMSSNPSPFSQMSFETTASFLTTATLSGDSDPLDSPSARLVMGQVVKGGTGAFSVMQPLTA